MYSIWAQNVQNCFGFWGSAPDPAGRAYDAPPVPLVVRGFLPSTIAVLRLRRLIPISPPKKKYPPHYPPPTQNPRTATVAYILGKNPTFSEEKCLFSAKISDDLFLVINSDFLIFYH